jgi:hypothetical protein
MLVKHDAPHMQERLLAEINEICPGLPEATAWGLSLHPDTGRTLASELDRRAAANDEPRLRGIADCVRLLCLPVPRDPACFDEHRRVGKSLLYAFRNLDHSTDQLLWCDLETFV